MANLKKLPANNLLAHQLKAHLIDVFLHKNLANPKLLLALSGGLDSTVLLHLLVDVSKTLPFQLQAQHIHHGLSKNADAWANFCEETCQKLNTPFSVSHIKINKNSGLGIEATARAERYKALLAVDADLVCLAHHQDDQAETLLLQLARGAGVKGLASMPFISEKLLRPLLDVPRSQLEAYAKQHQLTWIEDESNRDTKFDRNFMRHEIVPVLVKQYPAIKQTISRSAQHMAEAASLLDELAQQDVNSALQHQHKQQLALAPLTDLSLARVKNVLRWWLQQNNMETPSAAKLQQIVQQLLLAKTDAMIKITLSASHILRRFQGSAYITKKVQEGDHLFNRAQFSLPWQGEQVIILPDQSRLFFTQKLGAGINMQFIENSRLTIAYRQGKKTIKPEINRPSRSLKSLFQTTNIAPWQRERQPLLFIDADLVAMPNVAVDVRFKAAPNMLGLVVAWQDN
jgi:tRNA(Ile)-lysidine synthase